MEYQRRAQRLLSCLTQSVVKVAGGYYHNASRSSHHLELPNGQPVALAGAHKMMLNVEPYFRIRRHETQGAPHHIEIVGYRYVVYDSERREILAYHWHPRRRGFFQPPHLHLGAGAEIGFHPLVTKPHLPTGHIALGDVIRFLIQDLSVLPGRSDWEAVLLGTREPVPAQ